ncbi:hypothetical protein THERMOS_52 [Bathymodiolus thermophilus thioautotrophic gill symbiont]|uniref:Uncharacterized protein n=1 Tax=Bathymodiolus thermophilus thioautotrophic gill symbiont TaxID=2360 RepID=A0A8H8XBD2_9GAMM|nr:hypothetical protein THERMOS_52 [Bathymodiolus thermophilus thioautotrophic gill symbiont]
MQTLAFMMKYYNYQPLTKKFKSKPLKNKPLLIVLSIYQI